MRHHLKYRMFCKNYDIRNAARGLNFTICIRETEYRKNVARDTRPQNVLCRTYDTRNVAREICHAEYAARNEALGIRYTECIKQNFQHADHHTFNVARGIPRNIECETSYADHDMQNEIR